MIRISDRSIEAGAVTVKLLVKPDAGFGFTMPTTLAMQPLTTSITTWPGTTMEGTVKTAGKKGGL